MSEIILRVPKDVIPEWMFQLADDMVYHRGISKLEALEELLIIAIESAKAY